MASRFFTPVLGWVAAIGAAIGLSTLAPHERLVLGKVPPVAAKRLDHTPVTIPQGLESDRTLAVVVFKRSQREQAQSWIDGLRLHQDRSINWLRVGVVNDPGDEAKRLEIEQRLNERHPGLADPYRSVRVFTNKEAFMRSLGLPSDEHVTVLVIDREGNVLARAQGPFDETKAQSLRRTVLAQNDLKLP
jgi:hypothetical protein